MARYQLSDEDLPHAEEFLRDPFGYRSPGLQRLLNVMRGLGPAGKYVVVCGEPYKSWHLAQLPASRGQPIVAVPGVAYASLAEAERDVFLRRWKDLNGPDLGAILAKEHR